MYYHDDYSKPPNPDDLSKLSAQDRANPNYILFPQCEGDDEKLETLYPMYSLWAVGMPAIGADFSAAAENRSACKPPKMTPEGKPATTNAYITHLSALYRAALYNKNFRLNIALKNGQYRVAHFVTGGLWGESWGGPQPAKIMVIGKHPGYEEASTGFNFSGSSSQVFVRTLRELDVPEEETANWYMTNVVRFPHLDPKSATVPASWVKDCMPLLHQEFRLVHPTYVLCLGEDAIKAVLGRKHNLSTTSGQVIEMTIPRHENINEPPVMHTMKVMTCMHPARVSRQPDLEPQFKGMLRQFVDLAINGKAVGNTESDLIRVTLTNEAELRDWVDSLLKEGRNTFAVDCEWHGSYPVDEGSYLRTIQLSWAPKTGACIVVRDAYGNQFDGDYVCHLNRLLKSTPDRPTRLIGHNFRADLPWLVSVGIDLRPEFEAPEDDPQADGLSPTTLFGWQKTTTSGGFDTMLAVHSWQETHPLGLEACSSQLLGVPRYDLVLEEWKTEYCSHQKIKKTELEGYGECPDSILHPYGMYDADVTWRLFELLNQPGGLLDSDRNGNNSRLPFWISMRASPAFLEMEMSGVTIDRARGESITDTYIQAKNAKLAEFRKLINWPEFNPNSQRHKVSFLFGEHFVKKSPNAPPILPSKAIRLDLEPIKGTGRRPMMWKEVLRRSRNESQYERNSGNSVLDNFVPGTDKETMGILSSMQLDPSDQWKIEYVKRLRDLSFVSHVLKSVLRPPATMKNTVAIVQALTGSPKSMEERRKLKAELDAADKIDAVDEDGDKIFEKGLLATIHDDGKVRSHFFQTKETGRASSARPPLQNLSKRREPDYQRILGDKYKYALRSLITASPGCVLIEADYSAAEVAGVAWMSGDQQLIEHARRSALEDDDPDYFDIHSNIAVRAFRLLCDPTKKGLKSIGKAQLRTAAKAVFFGYLYGQGAESAARKAREEGADVSVQDAQALIDSLTRTYPRLVDFFEECRSRATDHGWMRNCFGRYRRFAQSDDRQVRGESERQAMNFPIQSLVADAMSKALDNLYKLRPKYGVDYKIVLQIHDAVILDVPIQYLEMVHDKVLPECMSEMVEVWPTTLTGDVRLTTKPYKLGIGREVSLHWGESIPVWAHRVMGIPEKYCDSGDNTHPSEVLTYLPDDVREQYERTYNSSEYAD